MKKVLMMLLVIGLASSGLGLGTALGVPALTDIKIGDGTALSTGMDYDPVTGTYTVRGSGTDIWGTNDSFEYAYAPISGNFDISCRLSSLSTTNITEGWTKAGIMVRQNINVDGASPYALIAGTVHGDPAQANNGISWQRRGITVPPATSGPLGNQSGFAYTQPVYLRMTRVGNIFNGYYSQDGVNWTWMYGNGEIAGDLDLALTDPVYIGLAACPHDIAGLATASFDTLTLNHSAATPSPARGATGIDYPTPIALSWGAIQSPDGPGVIKDWKVYFGTSPDEPNYVLLGTVSEPTRTINSPDLDPDKTYYWRVDATNTVNADVSTGFWWTFTTKTAKPIIDPLVNVSAAVNCLATLNATAKSGAYADQGDMTFVWKKSDGTVLTVVGPGTAVTSSYSQAVPIKNDPNTFFVEVTNKNGTTKSNEVRILVNVTPPFAFTHLDNGHGIAAGVGGSRSGDTFTLKGSGDDIWNEHDSCEFAYVPISGDGTLTARVVSLTNTNNWAKVGVMFRETLAADAKELTMVVTPPTNNRTVFQWRTATAGVSNNSASDRTAAPMWVRLVRSGTTFTGYYSTDGITWNQQGDPQTFAMNTDMYMGLANTSHDAALVCTAVFDNVSSTFSKKFWEPVNIVYAPLTPEKWVDPTKDLTISWTKAVNAPCGSYYKLTFSLDPDPTKSPLYTKTTAQDATQVVIPGSVASQTFPFNAKIYWRIDTCVTSGSVTDTEIGTVLSFSTVQQYPVIRTQPAQLTTVNAGAGATLNVVASSATTPTFIPLTKFEWFHVTTGGNVKVLADGLPVQQWTDPVDPLNPPANWGYYDCKLDLTNIQLADEGYYYCVATNAIGDTSSSNGLILTRRLVLHYQFETADVVNNIIADKSDSKFNATLVSPAGGTTKPSYSLVDGGIGLGKAVKLPGAADPNGAIIDTGKKPMELGISGNFPRTVSVWAKTYAFNEAGLFDTGAYATRENFCLRTIGDTNWTWRVQYYGADSDVVVNTSYNNWTHFVLVYDGARSRLYVNGQLRSDYAVALITSNANNLFLGRYNGNTNRYIGQMDDFRLYNYALTQDEAAGLYLAVKGGTVCVSPLTYDLNGDCRVDTADLILFAGQWLTDSL